jgi:hypothetical protein
LTLSPEGYLHDVELYGSEDINGPATFRTICRFRCLILLGEPGMGKTHAMQNALSFDAGERRTETTKEVLFDLRSYGS